MFVSSQGRFRTDGGSHLATTCSTRLGFACSHFTRNKGLGALGPWDILRCLQWLWLPRESPVSHPWPLWMFRTRRMWPGASWRQGTASLETCPPASFYFIGYPWLPIIVKKHRANALDVLSRKNQRFPMFSHVFFLFFPWSCIHEIALSGLVLVVVVGQVWVLQMMLIDTNYIRH